MASRVPLLVKAKSRKPSRGSVGPRTKPSYAPRAKCAATFERRKSRTHATELLAPRETAVERPATQDKSLLARMRPSGSLVEPIVKAAVYQPPTVSLSISSTKANHPAAPDATIAKAANPPRRVHVAVPLPQDHLTDTRASTDVQLIPAATRLPRLGKRSRSLPLALVQHWSARRAKSSAAEALDGTSPVVRARAECRGTSPKIRIRGTSLGSSPLPGTHDTVKHRLVRKLDIKPHHSPRRSLPQRLRNPVPPASPLVLGNKRSVDLGSGYVPEIPLCTDLATATEARRTVVALKPHLVATKRQKTREPTTRLLANELPRRSARQRAPRLNKYGTTETSSSSASEPEDERDDDALDCHVPADETNVDVPARERATLYATSLLRVHGKTPAKRKARRKQCGRSTTSSAGSMGIGSSVLSRSEMEALLLKEPSQMTMGELALTVPKGRRMKLYEREEMAIDSLDSTRASSSDLCQMYARDRVRTLSMASEAATLAGSLVTPQVQLIDGQMVVVESTVSVGDDLHVGVHSRGATAGLPPRPPSLHHSSSHPHGPGRRWSKDETKQFYYCLSQVGPNFSILATLFPTRKRKELKGKFKYEEKKHAKLIDIALRAATAPLDPAMVDVISQMVDKDAQAKDHYTLDTEDTTSVASATASSLASSTPQEAFVETMDDGDLFRPNRCDSYDFSG